MRQFLFARALRFRRPLLIGTLVAAYVVPLGIVLSVGETNLALQVFALAVLGTPALLGMWAVLGPGPDWARIPRMLLWLAGAVALALLPIDPNPDPGDWLNLSPSLDVTITTAFLVGGFLASCFLFVLLRSVGGWRLVPAGDSAADVSTRQISLRALLGDIAVLGIVLAVFGRVAGEVTHAFASAFLDPDEYWVLVISALFLAGLQLPMVPIVRLVMAPERPRVGWSIVAAAGLFAIVVLAEGTILAGWGDTVAEIAAQSGLVGIAYSGSVASLFVLRLAGYRLVTRATLSQSRSPRD